jgi:hypothetical protein
MNLANKDWLRRPAACVFLAENLGCAVSIATIRRWPIRYRMIGREAVYAKDDLMDFVVKRFNGPYRMPAPLKRSKIDDPRKNR